MTTAIINEANITYRDFNSLGIPATGRNEPNKTEIRALFAVVDSILGSLGVNGAIKYKRATYAELDSIVGPDLNDLAIVYNDAPELMGIYAAVGSWQLTPIGLPFQFYDMISSVMSQSENVLAAADAFGEVSTQIGPGEAGVVTYNGDTELFAVNPKAEFKGDPGGNVMAIGLKTAASALTTLTTGVDRVATSGFAAVGQGAASYAYDPTVTAITAAANPLTQFFVTSSARGYRLNVDQVLTTMVGARNDLSTDDAPSIVAALNNAPWRSLIGDTGSGSLLKATIAAPYQSELLGGGVKSWLHSDAGAGLENIRAAPSAGYKRMFRLNLDASSVVIQNTAGNLSNAVKNFRHTATLTRAAGRHLVLFEFAGSQKFEDIRVTDVRTVIRQADTYCDFVNACRIQSFQQDILTTDTYRNGYLIELPFPGDGMHISQILSSGATDENGVVVPGRSLYARLKTGFVFDNILNGHVVIEDCHDFYGHSMHMEDGQVRIINSSGKLHSATFFMRDNAVPAYHLTPLIIETLALQAGVNAFAIELSNINFLYSNKITGTLWNYPRDLPNFKIEGNSQTSRIILNVRDVYRLDQSDSNQAHRQLYGSTCGDAVFDAYTHIASRNSRWNNGAWEIVGALPAIPTAGSAPDGLAQVTNDPLNHRRWDGATGTYYYKLAALYDPIRMLGLNGTFEISASAVNGAAHGIEIAPVQEWRGPFLYRLYRGTSAGVYDSYIDIALVAGARLYDSGLDICGMPWIARTPGGVDTLNSTGIRGFKIAPGGIDTASDAYGNVTVRSSSNSIPTVGGWRRGDVFELDTPFTDGFTILLGYRRRTNCTKAATSNTVSIDGVSGDWDPILVDNGIPQATTTQLQSLAATINTDLKRLNRIVRNTTTQHLVFANGSAANATWTDVSAGTVYTPV